MPFYYKRKIKVNKIKWHNDKIQERQLIIKELADDHDSLIN